MSTRPELQTAKLLTASAEQYREILQNVEDLLKILDDCDYSQLDEYALKLQQTQALARQQDEVLLPLLLADFTTWKDDELYLRRLGYIDSILRLNNLLVPKIRGMMAVTSVELKKMSGSRTALAGYSLHAFRQRELRGIG